MVKRNFGFLYKPLGKGLFMVEKNRDCSLLSAPMCSPKAKSFKKKAGEREAVKNMGGGEQVLV